MTTSLTACVLVPDLLVQLAVRHAAVRSPFAVVDDTALARVRQCCPRAATAGVTPGMPTFLARQHCPRLMTLTLAASVVDTLHATITTLLYQQGDQLVALGSAGWCVRVLALGPEYGHASGTAAAAIAAQLGETHAGARATIWRTVRTLGPERAQAFVAQAQEVEANGGMLIPDGSRKRTLGGIFFYLVRTQISDDEAMQINRAWRWQQWKQRQPKKPKAATVALPPPTLPPFVWDEAAPIIAELSANVGEASTVKATIIGRPSQVVERQGVVVVALRSTKAPTLPKGLPPLPSTPTTYMLFIQQKQWTKVRDAMQQPDDALIVEGYGVHEPRFAGITVYATQVTTKALQAAKRKEQQAAPVHEGRA